MVVLAAPPRFRKFRSREFLAGKWFRNFFNCAVLMLSLFATTTFASKPQQLKMQPGQQTIELEQLAVPLQEGTVESGQPNPFESSFRRRDDLPDVPTPKSSADATKSALEKTEPDETKLAKAGSVKTKFAKVHLANANPPRIGRRVFTPSFLIRSAAVYGASFADMHEWVATRNELVEQNPLAKPFSHLPVPAYYGVGFMLATGVNFLSYKMDRSPRWHRFRYLPQLISIGGNTYGFFHTRYSAAHCPTCIIPTG